jgi:hypothetical protein
MNSELSTSFTLVVINDMTGNVRKNVALRCVRVTNVAVKMK